MGTSSSYGGPGGGTPLVPSWLDSGSGGGGDVAPPEEHAPDPDTPVTPPETPSGHEIPAPADPARFRKVRNNFTRFAGSGGADRRSLGRAVARYVSTTAGGSRTAARRMGASRHAGAQLLGFLTDVQARGAREALRALNLESLAGRPIDEVFLGLVDYVCPEGGTVDDGIAREAYVETIIELTEFGITDLDELSADQMQSVFEIYVTHAIEARLCNDVGTKLIVAPDSVQAALRVEQQLRDFIRNAVSDALTKARELTPALTQEEVRSFVDSVYERSFTYLELLGQAESNK